MESDLTVVKQVGLFGDMVNVSDIVYTPRNISSAIVKFLKPSGLCLDPCRGDGAFYDYLPTDKEYARYV